MVFIALWLSEDVHVCYGTPALIGSGKIIPQLTPSTQTHTHKQNVFVTHTSYMCWPFFFSTWGWRDLEKEARRLAEADSVQQHGVKIYLAAGKMTPLSLWLQEPHNNMLKAV